MRKDRDARRFAFLSALFSARSAMAIILYGAGNSTNLTDPGNGAPWANVGRFSNAGGTSFTASGIYVGNRYVLTADHVGVTTHFTFDGLTLYEVDGTFAPTNVAPGVDLKMLRLAAAPALPRLSLYEGANEINQAATVIGCGVGRDTNTPPDTLSVPWGGTRTAAKRWGANTPKGTEILTGGGYSYTSLVTVLGASQGADEAATTLYDSGSALFQNIDGVWHLTGVATDVTTLNSSTFGEDSLTSPTRGDLNSFARISSYSAEIAAIAYPPIPPPIIAGIDASTQQVDLAIANLTPGTSNSIDHVASLTSGIWTSKASFVATSLTTNRSEATDAQVGAGFYRIRSAW